MSDSQPKIGEKGYFVHDDAGTLRAAFGLTSDGGVALEMYDADGTVMLQAGIGANGPYMVLGSAEKPPVVLAQIHPDGRVLIGATDRNGNGIISTGIDEDGKPRLHVER